METKKNDHVAYSSSLDGFFNPKAIAVIGASEKYGSVGRTLLWNLIKSPFGGTVFPVNPNRKSVLGIRSYESISAIDEKIDLAIIVTRAQVVPEVMKECAGVGLKNAIIMSAFRKESADGLTAEDEVFKIAEKHRIRIIGPYSLGVMIPKTGLNATVTSDCAMPGTIGLISQSGTMCSAILDWSYKSHVGFSAFISVGKMCDVDWGDLIYFLGDDPDTKSIILYMETVGNPRSFLSAAKEVAYNKPIILIKGRKPKEEALFTDSYIGSLIGSDDILDAAFDRSGVLRVNSITDLFSMAEILEKQPLPKGRNLAIITNAGGPADLATDALIEQGGRLARLSGDTVEKLSEFLPAHWSHGNPIVGLGDDLSDIYAKAIQVVATDPAVHGILAVLTPRPTVDSTKVAETVTKLTPDLKIPLIASWMGGEAYSRGDDVFTRGGIPSFPFPEISIRIFNYMWKYRENLNALYETPKLMDELEFTENSKAEQILFDISEQARAEKRTALTEVESIKILKICGISVLPSMNATDEEDAVDRATEIGYPVAIKPLWTVAHPSNAGGVRLNLMDENEVRQVYAEIEKEVSKQLGSDAFSGVSIQAMVKRAGYELMIGTHVDPQFGPVIFFGTGGALSRTFQDITFGLPPLNTNLVHKMIEKTRIYKALKGTGPDKPVNLVEIEKILVRLGQFAIEQPWIKEIYIDPLFAGPTGIYALNARVIVFGEDEKSKVKPAIRPYPFEYVKRIKLKDGSDIVFRPIKPEDEPLMVKFHQKLSEQSVYSRYFSYMHVDSRIDHNRLSRVCFADYERNMILVAEPEDTEKNIVGVGRLIRIGGSNDAEFAIMIADKFHRLGMGAALLSHLIEIGKNEEMGNIIGYLLEENTSMIKLCKSIGFTIRSPMYAQLIEAIYKLNP
ncbi:MAG TPA: GNAT family N-acetyltransferase [Desulfobacterales bacterium]|nr:GNAT family N-acetyltransferase [Desulfobacterales bacterium]